MRVWNGIGNALIDSDANGTQANMASLPVDGCVYSRRVS